MSAIVAAAQRLEDRRIDAVLGRAFTTGDRLRAMIIAAGRAIAVASNAAGAGRVVEGAPLEVVGWKRCHRFDSDWAAFGHVGAIGIARHPQRRTDLRPTWLGGAWVWSTAAHDPRPCAWPRPFPRSKP